MIITFKKLQPTNIGSSVTVIRYTVMALLLSCDLAEACSVASYERQYAIVQGQLVYQENSHEEPASIKATLINTIEDVDIANFHRVASRSPSQSEGNGFWNDGNYFQSPSYYTDGKNVFYEGKKLENPTGTPIVNAASFAQPLVGTFAFDNASLYYNGKRVDDNIGAKQVDINSLKAVDEYLLMDNRNIYHHGQFVGSARGFQIITSKPYGDGASCESGEHVIARNSDTVFVDGVAIEADADTFELKRWMPDMVLDYTDKNGKHAYRYNRSEAELTRILADYAHYRRDDGFIVVREAVYYSPRENDPKTQLTQLPGVDPEHFRNIRKGVGADDKHIYELIKRTGTKGNVSVKIFPLTPNVQSIIDAEYSFGKSIIYFVSDSGVQEFKIAGELQRINNYFSHDEKNIYWFDGYQPALRFPTQDVSQIHLIDPNYAYSDLSTAEGVYSDGGVFSPMNTNKLEALDDFDGYMRDDKNIYYENRPVVHADIATFQVEGRFAKDKHRAYYYGRSLPGADSKSWSTIDSMYSRDHTAVFFGDSLIRGADPASFQVLPLGDRWAKDAKAVYYGEHSLPLVDLKTFKQVDSEYAKDAQHVFYENKIVEGADSNTFEVVDGKALDSARTYQAGRVNQTP
jgi:hypothetical protein